MEIKDRIKQLIINNGYTQRQASDALDITVRYCQKLEHGEKLPSLDMVMNIANFYDVSTDYILCRTDNPKRPR